MIHANSFFPIFIRFTTSVVLRLVSGSKLLRHLLISKFSEKNCELFKGDVVHPVAQMRPHIAETQKKVFTPAKYM